MPRILTGIQSSGKPHLGNLLGAILPAIQLSKKEKDSSFFFIADLHTLTSNRNGADMIENNLNIAAAWLACGLDTQKDVFYRQSDVNEVCELTWILNCFTPFPMLQNSHSFKDKSENLSMVSSGLFTYPVLMTADIILYNANLVPVGKDQRQHLEIARDIAKAFNIQMGETFVIPEAFIQEHVMTVPGTDGRKMSKSYGNTIDIFADDKKLRKQVMSIITDSTPVEDPKNPDSCIVFAIYSLLATSEEIQNLKETYLKGGMGYGFAKETLYQKILEYFKTERELFNHYISNPQLVEEQLLFGASKASEIAFDVLNKARAKVGSRAHDKKRML